MSKEIIYSCDICNEIITNDFHKIKITYPFDKDIYDKSDVCYKCIREICDFINSITKDE